MAENITILHLSDMQFGIHHRFGAKDTELDSLLNRLCEDLNGLKIKPDLIVLSGDLTEWAQPKEFDDLFLFVDGLSQKLNIPRKRIIMISGNHDINRKKCEHYFDDCQLERTEPKEPYFEKWIYYKRFFDKFYAGESDIQFTEEKPYSLFVIEELKVVVAGLNSTMKESHRDGDHYGFVGEKQLRWFRDELEKYKQQGWFRIAAVHHNVQRGAINDDENLKDAAELKRLLKDSVNLVLHGHTHQADLAWLTQKSPILATGSAGLKQEIRPEGIPNQYQIIKLHAQGLKRYCRAFIATEKEWGWDNTVHKNPAEPFKTEVIAFENINAAFPVVIPGKSENLKADKNLGIFRHTQESNKMLTWLHLSDFHVGLDDYGQTQIFKYILEHIEERKDNIDFVFITGDIAQSGLEKQYEKFANEFITPLKIILAKECRIFIVAGNHDVDRKKFRTFSPNEAINILDFFDPTPNGLENRQDILTRFLAYREFQQLYLDEQDWLNLENGYFIYKNKLKGVNLGILALNTAWLSKGEEDKENLTAGKAIVETGLNEIKNCDVKLVLGHHPINWFHDKEPIRSLFAKNQAVYLHGHLHKGSHRYEESAGHQFLAIQSGAAFQARENEKWINGLLWGELDFNSGVIKLEPRQWHKDNQEWTIDGSAFPDIFHKGGVWELPLPKKIQPVNPSISKLHVKQQKPFSAPLGWEILDLDELNKRKNEPDIATILKYFDGRIPNWGLALSKQIPRRKIVSELTHEINEAALTQQSSISILLGAGGEGKSTAFLQTIAAILETQNNWKVLYRKDENSKLNKSVMTELPQDYNWLIASDDADLIAEDVYIAAQNQSSHIYFLLAARDTDWYDQKLEKLKWSITFNKSYREKKLHGLIEEDAKKVVQAWANYQDDGLGKLANLSIEQATQRLLTESKSEVKQEGAFFGALLRVRYGDDLKGHIRKLLDRLKERHIMEGNQYTLLDAFSYIAAMHAENQLFLSKLILANVLNIEQGKLRSKVLHPLGEEAAASMAGEYIFTRHRAIAEITMKILEEETIYGIDSDEIYIKLVTTAEAIYQKGSFITNLGGWRYLSEHFFDKNNRNLAIRLTESLLDLDKTNSYLRVKLAQQFRKAEQPEQAIRVFRKSPVTNNSRSFFSEWGVDEGIEGCHALSVYLTGYALTDEATKKLPTNEDAKICLNGLSIACEELFKKYNNPLFIAACGAAAQLGLAVKSLDDRTKRELLKSKQIASEFGIEEVSAQTALKQIQEVIIVAYNQREDDLPTWLLKSEDLHFEGLKDLLNIR